MAAPSGGTGKDRQGKKPHKNKPLGKKYLHYKIEGQKLKKDPNCPRCGQGIFVARHKDRIYCGKCHYTEFTIKK